ncbi:MAG: GNAT family N-acetyltransferase [Cellulosilyticaceae bacterium]
MNYTEMKYYKDDAELCKSFNALTEKTFCFNFKKWHKKGFWGEKYIPYSVIDGKKVIANVSVNRMDFDMDGIEKHYIQIGTVMTDTDYRGQGLSRYLIEKVIDEYREKVDGIYLFGNDSVINFYPKFGFEKSTQYQYSKNIDASNNIKTIEPIDMHNKVNWESFFSAAKKSVSNARLTMDNLELLAFWTMDSEHVYYLAEENAYVIADVKEETLFIDQIIASHKVNVEAVIGSFGNEIKRVELGFTPYDEDQYEVRELHEEDSTLFILGKDLEAIKEKKLMFPTLSHA